MRRSSQRAFLAGAESCGNRLVQARRVINGRRIRESRKKTTQRALEAGGRLCLSCEESPARGPVPQANIAPGSHANWVSDNGLAHAGPSAVPASPSPPNASLVLKFACEGSFWEPTAHENTDPNANEVSHDDRFVWWAALPRRLEAAHEPPLSPFEAYGAAVGWPNKGFARMQGTTMRIELQAPQPYEEETGVWPRHVHFMRVFRDGRVDSSRAFTVGVRPSHHSQGYACHHLEGAHHATCCIVTPEQVRGLRNPELYWFIDATGTGQRLSERFHNFVSLSHRSSDESILKSVAPIGSSPVVVYCANPRCTAASVLLEKLMRLGVCPNVFYMPEGFQGYV